MTDSVTLETFAPHIGRPFGIRVDNGQPVMVTLIEASRAPGDEDARRTRAPFSLVFRLPAGCTVAQGMYVIEHEELGPVDIFLVPIVPDREGSRLQAVFA